MSWVPEKQKSHLLQENLKELENRNISYHKLKKLFTDSDIFELIYIGKCMKTFADKDQAVEYRKFLIRRKLIMEMMYTNGLSHRTEPIMMSQPRPGYQVAEVKMKKDFSQFVALYANDNSASAVYYRAFDEDSEQGYKYNEQVVIDEYKNFNFDAESKPKQFVVKIVNARQKQGIFSTIPFIHINTSS